MVDRFQTESDFIQEEAEKKLGRVRREIIVELKPLMTNYAREVKLDSALAVRDYIRALSELMYKVLPDPGTLSSYLPHTRGALYFRVTGRGGGSVWGTDIYTSDSTLATAAVHAGALKDGQTGVVKVTMLPGQDSYSGTTRNGITTSSYGSYHESYKVAASEDEELPER